MCMVSILNVFTFTWNANVNGTLGTAFVANRFEAYAGGGAPARPYVLAPLPDTPSIMSGKMFVSP